MTLDGTGIDPDRTALLNVDAQNCFVTDGPMAAEEGEAVLARINAIAAACRPLGVTVIHTRSVIRRDHADRAPSMSVAVADLCRVDAPTAALHPDLEVDRTDVVVDKPRFDAFYASDLEPILHARRIDTIVVTGFHTNLCCDTTTRSASRRNYRVLFAHDATGTRSMGGVEARDLRLATCASLGTAFATVVTSDEVIGHLDPARAAARLR